MWRRPGRRRANGGVDALNPPGAVLASTGTAGASQGEGHPRFGVTRLTFNDDGVGSCFHEVPAPGTEAPGEGAVTDFIDFCTTD